MDGNGVIAWLIAGAVAGMVAKIIAGGWDAAGCVATIGVAGACLAGYGWTQLTGFANAGATDGLAAIGGAILALWVFGTLAPRS